MQEVEDCEGGAVWGKGGEAEDGDGYAGDVVGFWRGERGGREGAGERVVGG